MVAKGKQREAREKIGARRATVVNMIDVTIRTRLEENEDKWGGCRQSMF